MSETAIGTPQPNTRELWSDKRLPVAVAGPYGFAESSQSATWLGGHRTRLAAAVIQARPDQAGVRRRRR